MELTQSFTVNHPPEAVWGFFADPAAVAPCLPGASLTGPAAADKVEGAIAVKLGPISASFAGAAEIERDDAALAGVIRGQGRDKKSGSRAKGEIRYALAPEDGGAATRVDLTVDYNLTGALAQFSRGSLVTELAAKLTEEFAQNLEAALAAAGDSAAPAPTTPMPTAAQLDVGALVAGTLWARIKRWFAGLFGRT